jgi:hypothetical protein
MKCKLLLLLPLLLVSGLPLWGQTDDIQMQDTLSEVLVKSQSAVRRVNELQIGIEKVDVETMSLLPAMLGERDIIKGLQLLPGVKGEGDGLGGYQVRGGTSSQNLILLDGASAFNVGHLVGLFSSFNDDAVGSVDLFKGLMPARFGGGSSSVLNMTTRSGDTDAHHLSATVGLLSAKVEADGPIGAGGSSYLVAGRTSYLNIFIKASGKYSDNSLSFYDLNAKLNFKLSDSDKLYFSLFRGHDVMEVEKMMNMSWGNTTASLGWLHNAGRQGLAHTQLVASDYSTDQGLDVYSFDVDMQGYNRQLTLRHQQTWPLGNAHTLNAGGESTWLGVQSAGWRMLSNHEREKRDGWIASLWAADDMSLFAERLQLSLGLRCEWLTALGGKPYYTLDDDGRITATMNPRKWSRVKTYTVLQPRFSLAWKVTPLAALKVGYSRVAQPVQPIRNSSMTLPIDRMAIMSNNVKPQMADQVAAGLSLMTADSGWDFSADAYYKKIQNVYDYREGMVFNTDVEIERLIVGGRGRAYGLEVAAHKNKGRTTGWVAYTLSRVQNKIEGIMNGAWYTAGNDRRHDLVVVLMSQLSRRWTLSSTWRYTTGQAMTAPAGKYELEGETHYYFGERNVNRAPAYHRLDIGLSHSTTRGRATRTWTFGLYNAYNRYNPFFISFKDDDSKSSGTKTVVTSIFGIVPTVSFTYKY